VTLQQCSYAQQASMFRRMRRTEDEQEEKEEEDEEYGDIPS
jgi:hypothetical protein